MCDTFGSSQGHEGCSWWQANYIVQNAFCSIVSRLAWLAGIGLGMHSWPGWSYLSMLQDVVASRWLRK